MCWVIPPASTSDDVGIADVVEERRLTVVNVPHHSDDRRTLAEVFFVVHLFDDGFLHFGRDELGGETKFFCHHFDGFLVETLVDRHHDADAHAGADDLCHGDIHHRSQFVGSHKLGELEHAASASRRIISSSWRSRAASRFSRRYFAPLPLLAPLA